eukprot:Gb_38835 [translate_table: standard]
MALAMAILPSAGIMPAGTQSISRTDSLQPWIAWKNIQDGFRSRRDAVVVFANSASSSQDASAEKNSERKKRVDTRIHWDNPDEGWIGGPDPEDGDSDGADGWPKGSKFGDMFGDILSEASNSHYQVLGVPPAADMDDIKAAYRRLSKEYHPDSTSLPLEVASKKFMRLKEAYDVLSREDERQFYDWSLAQEVSTLEGGRTRRRTVSNPTQQVGWRSRRDTVERLGGRNMKLSDQAMTAVTFDAIVILFSIGCIIYTLYFKEEP